MPSLALEDFDLSPPARAAQESLGASDSEGRVSDAARMEIYEEGYQAGWDDAVKTQSEDQKRIGAEFARNLQELSFTFHEARAHVIQSMEPLLTEIVNALLPGLMAESFAQTLLEELRPLIAEAADNPIDLIVGPGCMAILEGPVSDLGNVAIKITEEPSLADGQAYFRIGKVERQVDLSGALESMRAAMSALFELNERTLKNG